ncbi:terminase small subunit [Rhizobium sp. 21-4511-3d]
MSDLSPKQARFVQEYLLDLNATQAAIRAGYSEKTAHSQGPRLLENVGVQAAIQKAKEQRADRTKINADWLLERLAEEATADIADLYTDAGSLKPIKEWPLIWRQGLVGGIEIETLRPRGSKGTGQWHGKAQDIHEEEEPEEETVVTKIKLSDRIRRLELIGKHVGVQAFNDKVEVTGKDGGPIETKETSSRDLAKAIAALLAKGLNANG